MSPGAIAAVCAVGTAVVGALVLATRAVLKWASEINQLRLEIAALRLEISEQRGRDRKEVEALIKEAINDHRKACIMGTNPRMRAYDGEILE